MNLNYYNTFIAISEDCPGVGETPPHREGKTTAAEVQYGMLVSHPYRFTQEDVLFEASTVVRSHPGLAGEEKAEARIEFLSKSQACLRASPLAKRYGWGIHFDGEGKAAAFSADSPEYRRFAADASLTQTRGMRSKRSS